MWTANRKSKKKRQRAWRGRGPRGGDSVEKRQTGRMMEPMRPWRDGGVSTIKRERLFLFAGLSTSHSIEELVVARVKGPRLCAATQERELARCFAGDDEDVVVVDGICCQPQCPWAYSCLFLVCSSVLVVLCFGCLAKDLSVILFWSR